VDRPWAITNLTDPHMSSDEALPYIKKVGFEAQE